MAGGITVAPPIIIPTKHLYTPRIYLTRIAHLIDDEGKIRPTFVTLTPSDFMEYLSFKTMLTFPPDRVMTSTSLSSIPLSVTWWKPIKPGQIYNEVVDPRTAPILTRPLTEIYSTLTVSWPTDIPLPSASLETTSSTTSTTSTSTTLQTSTSTSTSSIPFFKTWQKPIRSDDASNEAVDPRTATLSTRPLTEIYPTLTTSSSSSEETSAHRRTRTRDFTLFRAKFSPPSSKTSQASTAAEASAIPLHIKPSPARP
ncbi:uncharacterized protein CTRU02_207540 [Colletotrichum truncatum]|uniref:Uncharacterized protein n=1 Tax=Colletotrichum truncatum TaxID=5467 RepID=A0ACC3Z150_COLTU